VGRAFSIKISSREHLSNISISEGRNGVVVEGDLGELRNISLIECLMLEIKGTQGTLRFDITKPELEQVLKTRCED
jgi:hypothetical protein